ncbi:cobalamin biosynthesis protein [Rhizobiaceae bacterium BDR2-2]|uniref:Cobalamin biosynthesis protein n=1 Tax=Ectorhizobium quercum TaxID=2965071 RepID=A0AAE3SV83_9HYPH|nr:cobalamin biosynthesis protein [Ectorhizobium quercum]MCX8998060.1 cobalamin biosynthesis protein [Ectorhizobium quercum]
MGEAMIVAGIGCRRGTAAETILATLDAALAAASLSRGALAALATGALKAEEAGVKEAANRLGLPLRIADDAALAAAEPRLLTRSEASHGATGSGSLCEAAALAAAGEGASLLAPRFIREGVTVALARMSGDHP